MIAANPLTSITALVPYFENSKEKYEIVPFKVFEREGTYLTIPLIPDVLREKMALPEQLQFRLDNNRIVAISEGSREVLINIVKELQMLHLV